MLSTRVTTGLYLPQEHQRVFPIFLVPPSESDDNFSDKLFWNTWIVHVLLQLFKARQVFILLSFTLFSPIIFIFPSTAYCISSEFDIFITILVLSSKFVLSFLRLLDILYKKALSTFFFFFFDDVIDQKEINNFLF